MAIYTLTHFLKLLNQDFKALKSKLKFIALFEPDYSLISVRE